jgi:hypothetical protein
MDITDIQYVQAVINEQVASNVVDGELDPPKGARCRTRSGFRAWLRRAKKSVKKAVDF